MSSDPPAVSCGPGRIDVVAVGGEGNLYHKFFEGGWSNAHNPMAWQFLGFPKPIHLEYNRPTISSWGPNRLDIFAEGVGDRLYQKWWEGRWSDESDGFTGGWKLLPEIRPQV